MSNTESNLKVVGKRKSRFNANWEQANDFLKLVIELNRKNKFIPKGIYRFKSHLENDEWIMKVLTEH